MVSTIGDSVATIPTIGDLVADRIPLSEIPATLHVAANFDPNMGRSRIGYRWSIDGEYASVEVLVYTNPDDAFPETKLSRADATASRIAGGRRVKFTWELGGGRLVTMTCPVKTPADALQKLVVSVVEA